jgi:hypothetical protein
MEIKIYKWNDTKVDIYGLMEFASRSKFNMIKTLELVLSLGRKFPDISFGFYDLEVAAGSLRPIEINISDKSPSEILEKIEKTISV